MRFPSSGKLPRQAGVSILSAMLLTAVMSIVASTENFMVHVPSRVQVAATAASETTPQCVTAKKAALGKTSSPADTQVFGSSTGSASPSPTIEQDKCYGAILKDGKTPSQNIDDYQCVGKSATISMDAKGKGTIKASADKNVAADKCKVSVCNSSNGNCGAAISCNGSDSMQKCLASSPDALKTLSADQVQQVTRDLGVLDPASQQLINNAFQQQIQTAQTQIQTNNATKDGLQKIIDGCANGSTSSNCSSDNIASLKEQQAKLDQENAALQKQMSALAAAQVALKPPPTPAPTPTPTPTQPQQPRLPTTGFGTTPFGSLTQPPPGNQIAQPIGSCTPQYTCSGSTLYSRDTTCVDRVVQYCPYGCQGSTCAIQPQQQCAGTPAQPDPSTCTVGTWRPTYSGNCVTNWQCVPDATIATPSAQISCSPKIADVGMTIAVSFGCTNANASVGSGFDTGGSLNGSATVPAALPDTGNTATYSLTCSNLGQTAGAQCSVQVGKPSIVLVANPAKVERGNSTSIGWITSGMSSCVVSSPELADFSSQNEGITNVNGAVNTPPLTASARFLLHCSTFGGGTRDVVTNVAIASSTTSN